VTKIKKLGVSEKIVGKYSLEHWAKGNGQWAMGNGQWAMGNGQRAMGNGIKIDSNYTKIDFLTFAY